MLLRKPVRNPLRFIVVLSLTTATFCVPKTDSPDGNGSETGTPTSGVSVEYLLQNVWASEFTANVVITNNSGSAVNGWGVTWTFANGQQVVNAWNADVAQSGSVVTAGNVDDNSVIPVGGTVSFGFRATFSGANEVPSDLVLHGESSNSDSEPDPDSSSDSDPDPDSDPDLDPNSGPTVGLYKVFELSVENSNSYGNKFVDVELQAAYTAPSGRKVEFWGFFDGDGNGGGDAKSGNVWKLRFMPDELGEWSYSWSWSDGTTGGAGTFVAVQAGAGKGILRAYEQNPRWFAYNGTTPVWLKSYYETGHGAIAQPFDWIEENVYKTLVDRGYNHLQVNWFLPLCCDGQYYRDGPDKSIDKIRLFDEDDVKSTMQLNVWHMMEEHVHWLNDRDVGLHMFLGFSGGRNDGPDWAALSDEEQVFYVRYVVARIAPYANVAGWNFVWEVDGDDGNRELELAQLLEQYDIFEHLRTYEDETPGSNEFDRSEYSFAAVENHGYTSDKGDWARAWTHHEACLDGYVTGKPVYMSEGNALWRRFWHKRINEKYGTVDQNDLRQSAWACATAAASFCWNGHADEDDLVAFGERGLPFFSGQNSYEPSALAIDVVADVMNNDVRFYRMTPHDELLSSVDDERVWCLAETGHQYLVFSMGGDEFSLKVASGAYDNNKWVDTQNGNTEPVASFSVSAEATKQFAPPSKSTDWVLILNDE